MCAKKYKFLIKKNENVQNVLKRKNEYILLPTLLDHTSFNLVFKNSSSTLKETKKYFP